MSGEVFLTAFELFLHGLWLMLSAGVPNDEAVPSACVMVLIGLNPKASAGGCE